MLPPNKPNYNTAEKLLLTKRLVCDYKIFYIDLKENKRGRFLKISEKDSASKRTIIVPFEAIGELSETLKEVVAYLAEHKESGNDNDKSKNDEEEK